jgi:hypothetical protein
MDTGNLESGEMVVPLRSLARQAAVISGFLTGFIVVWSAWGGFLYPAGQGLICAVLGYFFCRVLFPKSRGMVEVVRASSEALPRTLRTALAGAAIGAQKQQNVLRRHLTRPKQNGRCSIAVLITAPAVGLLSTGDAVFAICVGGLCSLAVGVTLGFLSTL